MLFVYLIEAIFFIHVEYNLFKKRCIYVYEYLEKKCVVVDHKFCASWLTL